MNEEAHWNLVAPAYENEVLDVFSTERNGTLQRYFNQVGDRSKFAIDFGCGIGNGFHYLSKAFGKILAVDISAACLSQAKKRGFPNIEFKKANLASSKVKLPQADFILCSNVAILPDVEKDYRIISNAARALNRGGKAIFVIPSLDSILYSAWRLIDWYGKEGVDPRRISRGELTAFKGTKLDLLQGIVDVGGVPTKHYSLAEIQVLFPEKGFKITAIDKLEYSWKTEFNEPPNWMKAPYPWDWLVVCEKADLSG